MGSGAWTKKSFSDYTTSKFTSRGLNVSYSVDGSITSNFSNQDMFVSRKIQKELDPMNVMRECLDSDEHPFTVPIILALDVTGSLGQCAVEIAKKLNPIITTLYEKIKDVEFCIMGIGDLAYDRGPIQISQFESDIRIAEQLDKLWFEFGGGGNYFESYTAAWYMGTRHCMLDCWNRGKRGIIITIGDERLNPYLPKDELRHFTGDALEADVETSKLLKETIPKYDIYHVQVNHGVHEFDKENIKKSFSCLGENYKEANLDNISDVIIDIVTNAVTDVNVIPYVQPKQSSDGITW